MFEIYFKILKLKTKSFKEKVLKFKEKTKANNQGEETDITRLAKCWLTVETGHTGHHALKFCECLEISLMEG